MSDKKIQEVNQFSDEQVEHAPRRQSVSEEITELSGIEATAASKAAWLISITVSIGGFLFGEDFGPYGSNQS
jgi:SP family myo-inositol transporter-like MFS transporter 13